MRTGRSRASGDVQINGATGESYSVALKRSRRQQDVRTAEAMGAQVQVGRRFGDTRSYGEATVDTSLCLAQSLSFCCTVSAHLLMYHAGGGMDRRCRSWSLVGRFFNEEDASR